MTHVHGVQKKLSQEVAAAAICFKSRRFAFTAWEHVPESMRQSGVVAMQFSAGQCSKVLIWGQPKEATS